jgi:hypothetical protein
MQTGGMDVSACATISSSKASPDWRHHGPDVEVSEICEEPACVGTPVCGVQAPQADERRSNPLKEAQRWGNISLCTPCA